jgi:sugar O-acyltransferase (sialic acid O-acetyltransferase NeuD family)
MTDCIITGYSGHAYVVIDAAIKSGLQVIAYCDVNKSIVNPFELEYLGNENSADYQGWATGFAYILGIGSNSIRRNIFNLLHDHNEKVITVIHPSAIIGLHVKIGNGTFVSSGVEINPMAKVGEGVIVNTGAIVEHECIIEDFAHIAPGAVLSGNVKIGKGSFIGANSVIKQGIQIGKNVIIGAGSVIINDVEDGMKYAGNPGREL